MSKHFEIIRNNCEVVSEVIAPYPGILYKEDGFYFAEFETPSGTASYLCDGIEDFQMMCESISADDGESIDDMDEPSDLEMGFDPYDGCYTFDC